MQIPGIGYGRVVVVLQGGVVVKRYVDAGDDALATGEQEYVTVVFWRSVCS